MRVHTEEQIEAVRSPLEDIITPVVQGQLLNLRGRLTNNFFMRFVRDDGFGDERTDVLDALQTPEIVTAVEEFIEYTREIGLYERTLRFLLSKFELEFSRLDEITLFGIWMAFYNFPWESENWDNILGFIFVCSQQLVLESRRTNDSSLNMSTYQDYDSVSATRSDGYSRSPELVLIEQDLLLQLIQDLFETMGGDSGRCSQEKRQFLELIAAGYNPVESGRMVGISYPTIRSWLQKCRERFPEDTVGRIEKNTNGDWIWNVRTAELILNIYSNIPYFLNEKEQNVLQDLIKFGSAKEIALVTGIGRRDVYKVLTGIKTKIEMFTTETEESVLSFCGRRMKVVAFLRFVEIGDEKGLLMREEIIKANGNLAEAERSSVYTRGQLEAFLRRLGYKRG